MKSYRSLTIRLLIISCLSGLVLLSGSAKASDVGNQNSGMNNCTTCMLPSGCDSRGEHVNAGAKYCL